MNYNVNCSGKHTVRIERKAETSSAIDISVGKSNYAVQVRKVRDDGTLKTLMVDHKVCPVEIERRGDGMPFRVFLKGIPYDVEIAKVASTRFKPPIPEREISGDVCANLPGQIVDILVQEGQYVEPGTPLVVLDAMKMENEIMAHKAGTVEAIAVKPGQILAKGDLILQVN